MSASTGSAHLNLVSNEINIECQLENKENTKIKLARIIYGVLLVIIVTVICWRLLQASDRLQVQREREASRLEVIPHTKDGLILVHSMNLSDIGHWKMSIDRSLMGENKLIDIWIKTINYLWFWTAYSINNDIPDITTCSYDKPISSEKTCEVDLRSFGSCSSEKSYGFDREQPCIFLKFKKIKDWVPKNLNISALPKEMPEDLQDHIKNSNKQKVWLSCEGDTPVDVENIGPIQYHPERGYPAYFFPYTSQKDYLEPIVAIELERPTRKKLNFDLKYWKNL